MAGLTFTPSTTLSLGTVTIPLGSPVTGTASITFYADQGQAGYIRWGTDSVPVPANKLYPDAITTISVGGLLFDWIPPDNFVKWGYTETLVTGVAMLTYPSVSPPITTGILTSTPSPTSSTTPIPSSSSPGSRTGGTQSSTSSPTHSVAPSTKTSTVSKGAAAGIAIGCLLGGALIAGLLVWFCLGKRGRRHNGRDREASALALIPSERSAGAKVRSLESSSPLSQIAQINTPQPLEDKAITGEISKISNLVKNHVQSFYHTGRSPGLLDLDELQALGDDLPLSSGTLSTLLGNSDTREIALRFCIAWVIVSRMRLQGSASKSLLPREIVESYQSIAFPARTGPLIQWRVLTAQLMQSIYVQNSFTASDRRIFALETALDDLEGILVPFVDARMDKKQRRQNLEELLKRSAKFAFTLFSQPSTWDFDWQEHQGVTSGSLCVFPALVQITDDAGEVLKPPRAFSEAVVRRLDE